MADPLADMINGLTAIQNGASPGQPVGPVALPRKPQDQGILTGTGDLWSGTGLSPIPERWGNILSATLPAAVGTIASAPTGLYGLADKVLDWASGGSLGLPGGQRAREITGDIQEPFQQLGEKLAGEKLNDSLINTNDPAQMAGAWARLGTTALVQLPGAAAKIAEGAKQLETSINAVNKTGEYALKSLEVLTPMMLRPATPLVAGLNVGIPAAGSIALDLIFPKPEDINAQTAQAADAAVSGAETAAQGAQTVKQVVKPVQAGFTTGIPWLDAAIIGVGIGATVAAYKSETMRRVLGGMTKEGQETGFSSTQAFHSNIVDEMGPPKDMYAKALEEIHSPAQPMLRTRMNEVIDSHHGAAIDTKLQGAYQFGEIPGSNIKLPPVVDTFTAVKNLGDPARVKTLEDGLIAEAELANRQRLMEASGLKLSTPGQYGTVQAEREYFNALAQGRITEDKTAFNFNEGNGNVTRTALDLRQAVNAMNADAELVGIARQLKLGYERMLDYRIEQGHLTLAGKAQIMKEQPALIAYDKAPGKSQIAGREQVAPAGGSLEPGGVLRNYPKMIEETFRAVEGNKANRLLIGEFKNARNAGSPTMRDLLGREDVRLTERNEDKFVSYKDHNGNARNIEIKDPYVRRAMQNMQNRAALHMLNGAVTIARRTLESSATGVIASSLGQPFSHTAALYAATFGPAMRPFGISVGYGDKLLQDVLHAPFGLRGDPTGMATIPYHALTGVTAVLAQKTANVLHRSVLTNGRIANTLTPQTADAVATAFSNHFKRSWVYFLQQHGLLGPSAMESVAPDTAIKHVQQSMINAGAPVQVIKDTLRTLNDLLHAVSASPGAVLLSLNKGKDPLLVANAIREFTGDPGKSGAFRGGFGRTVGELTGATPWGNVFIQTTNKFIRDFRKDPIKVSFGAAVTVGIPAAISVIWAATLPDYVDQQGIHHNYSDYQLNKRNADRQANSIYFAVPGLHPEQGFEIPVDPLMRTYKYASEALTSYQIGAWDGSLFKPENDSQRNMYRETMRSRWGLDGPVVGSIVQNSLLPPMSPIVTAPLAAFGVKLHGFADAQDIHGNRNAGFTTSDSKDPSREVLGLHESAKMEEVIRSIGANSMYLAYNIFQDAIKRGREGQSGNEIIANAGKQIKQGSQDSFRSTGPLLGTFSAISPSQEASGTLVSDKVKGIKSLIEAMNSQMSGKFDTGGAYVGSKQRGYQELPGGATAVQAVDPQMMQLAQDAKFLYQQLEKGFLQPNKDDYAKRQAIQASTRYDPEMKRSYMNLISNEIIARDRAMLTFLQQQEMALSKRFGVQVRFDKLNLNQPVSQFPANP